MASRPPMRSRGGAPPPSSSPSPAPAFAETATAVTKDLVSAQKLLGALSRLIRTVGTARDSARARERMGETLAQLKDKADELGGALQRLDALARDKGASKKERDGRRVRQKRLAKDYHAFVGEFNRVAQEAKAKQSEKRRERAAARGRGGRAPEERGLLDADADDDDDGEEPEAQTLEYLDMESDVRLSHALVHEKRDVVVEVSKDMACVEEMFHDLAAIVEDQGSMVDSIERNAAETAAKVGEGYSELRRAAEYQKRARNKMCCMVLLFVLSALAGTLLILHFSHRLTSPARRV